MTLAPSSQFTCSIKRKDIKAQRPQQILEAAFAEFTEKGYAAARLEDVAKRVGLSKGALYLYFPTKAELFKAMIRAFVTPCSNNLEEIPQDLQGNHLESMLFQLRSAYKRCAKDRHSREFFRLMIAEGARIPELRDFYTQEIMAYGVETTTQLLNDGVEKGLFNPEVVEHLKLNPEMISAPFTTMQVMQMITGEWSDQQVESWADAHIALLMNGMIMPSYAQNTVGNPR